MPLRLPSGWTPLHVALGVSAVAHASILTVRFVDPAALERVLSETPLEVVLVNARTREAPLQAQAIAQASLAGGGEASRGLAQSPLPLSAQVLAGDASQDSRQQIRQLQEQQQVLLAQVRQALTLMPAREAGSDGLKPEDRAQEERRRQLLRMLAQIEKRVEEENARPKKRYISPATREAAYALYYDGLRRRIEERGTVDFPQAQGQKLYGTLMMNLTIDAEGRLLSAEVVEPSGQRQLDQRAVAIVRAAGPYGRFTENMRKEADQIVVTSRFRFSREDGMETSMHAVPR